MQQRRPRTVAHLKTFLQEEWDKITPETLHHLVSSVPKRLLSVCEKEWQHYKVVNALLSQLFLECVASLNDRKGCIFTNDMKLTRQNMNILCSYCLQWNTSQSKFRNHYFLFLLRFPYCPNFFWFGVVVNLQTDLETTFSVKDTKKGCILTIIFLLREKLYLWGFPVRI